MSTGIRISLLAATSLFAVADLVSATPLQEERKGADRSPVQRPRSTDDGPPRDRSGGSGGHLAVFPLEFRTIDGAGNNSQHPEWGAAETIMLRLVAPDYADGAHAPAGAHRPSPRSISNEVVAQAGSLPNSRGASDFLWMWGQFLDHDVTETPIADPAEAFDIPVAAGDAWFDPAATGLVTLPLDRSSYEVVDGARQQVNLITAFIDASNVYGSDEERAHDLRTLDGTGRLRTSAGDLLPFNENELPNAPNSAPSFFIAGDIRANEQVALAAMHTLFVREHNFWAGRLASLRLMDGEAIYQFARALVAAEMQAITYREFLPVLLGKHALPPYHGYRPDVDPSIANEFATAGYRVGHTMLSPQLLRLQADGSPHPAGHLSLAGAFFNPQELTSIGIAPYLRGLSRQMAQEVDPFVIDDVRNFLFGPPGAGGLDLPALNIQRGRDHGLPSYNEIRTALGGPRAAAFDDMSSNAEIRARLTQAYAGVDDVDAWLGFLCEDPAPGAMVGPTLRTLLSDQFRRLRDGDRFWYQVYMPSSLVGFIEDQTLARIIRRNTEIGAELPDDVFYVP